MATVQEVIECLQKFDKNLPVVAQWEGITVPVRIDRVEFAKLKDELVLEIDVNNAY